RRHTRSKRDWSSDVCSSDLGSNGGGRSRIQQKFCCGYCHTAFLGPGIVISKAPRLVSYLVVFFLGVTLHQAAQRLLVIPLVAQRRTAPARWWVLAWVLPPQARSAVLLPAAQMVRLAHFESTCLFPMTSLLARTTFSAPRLLASQSVFLVRLR